MPLLLEVLANMCIATIRFPGCDFKNLTLTLYAPISQSGQTDSNNSSENCRRIVCVFDHFVGLALKGLTLTLSFWWSRFSTWSKSQDKKLNNLITKIASKVK